MTSRTIAAFLTLLALVGCRSGATTQAPPAQGYTLVWIRTGPQDGALPDEARQTAFAGHFANMERMASERKLLLAGPFGAARHAEDLRGLFVLDTTDRAEAEAWASTDPTTRAGIFRLEYDGLTTAMPLGAMLTAELERLARQRSAGATPSPGDGGRGWALLIAEQGDLAQRELAPLATPEGGVVLLAALSGGRALAVLDAANAAGARERFRDVLPRLGAHTVDDWFATDLLMSLVP